MSICQQPIIEKTKQSADAEWLELCKQGCPASIADSINRAAKNVGEEDYAQTFTGRIEVKVPPEVAIAIYADGWSMDTQTCMTDAARARVMLAVQRERQLNAEDVRFGGGE